MTLRFKIIHDQEIIIDNEDWDLMNYTWTPVKGKDKRTTYATAKPYGYKRGTFRMHRIILERVLERPLEKWELVDHENSNGLDNRRCNLRLANQSQSSANTRPQLRVAFKGVHAVIRRSGSVRYRATIAPNGKSKHLGYFDTAEEAHEEYKKAAIKYFGEYARWE